ncbi:MAG TPA: EAL domain-containing protein, partial [Chloroflexota bacterium]|nr:EAL domain-containing protein [Chloroflexota bacterium]
LDHGAPISILLVEDNAADAFLVQHMLSECAGQFRVIHVTRLREAIDCLAHQEIGGILLDLSLPDAHGLEAVARLHDAAPQVPIVVMSGNDDESLAVAGVREGAQDYLVKGKVASDLLTRALRYAIERQRSDDRLAYLAHHDALTELPNRLLFNDRLEQALRASIREPGRLAVLQIDLNRFKAINDTCGHAAGDTVLTVVAARMRAVVRVSDTVARFGGDEFAVLLPGADEAGALRVANQIRSAVSPSIELADRSVSVSASIGIALYPEQAEQAETLLHNADVAMYVAKTVGGGAVVYSPDLEGKNDLSRTLAGELRAAIADGQLRLHYQPVFDLGSARVGRVEALVRWQHPTHGLLPPDRFIPLAEQTGAIGGLTLWVLEESLRQCRAWRDEGHSLGVSVNVCIQTLQDRQFPDLVSALLRRYDLSPELLTLEITERSLMTEPEQVVAVLSALAALGVRIAMDDFGVGQSSLGVLSRLRLHEIKIDRSFITQADTDHGAALVSFILGLGVTLGLGVVVEGVETRETWDWLRNLGCPAIQGYYVSRPAPAAEFISWLTNRAQAHPRGHEEEIR